MYVNVEMCMYLCSMIRNKLVRLKEKLFGNK